MPVRRPAALLCACLCLLTTVAVLAGATTAQTRDDDGVVAADHPDNPALDPGIRARIARSREEQRQREQARATPKARERRARSRTAYGALSNAAALEVLRAKFGDLFEGPVWQGVPERGFKGFVGDYTARVANGPGEPDAIMESSLPLRVERGGEKVPVSLALEDRGDALVPEAPLVDLRIGRRAADGISVPGAGVRIRPAGAAGAEATVVNDRVVYPNTGGTDTDFIVVPQPQGAETFWQLRSADAPETLRQEVDLPEGGALRLRRATPPDQALRNPLDPGAHLDYVEILDDGEVVGQVAPPSAVDASGEQVPVSLSLDGSDVVVRVDHRGGDFEAPILVDPTWVFEGFWDSDYNGFYDLKSRNEVWMYRWHSFWGWGMYIGIYGDNQVHYNAGDWFTHKWTAPGTSFIYGSSFHNLRNDPSANGNHRLYTGIYSQAENRWVSYQDWYGGFDNHWRVHCANGWYRSNSGPDGGDCPVSGNNNSVEFGVSLEHAGWRWKGGTSYVNGVRTWLSDPENPTVTASGTTTSWTQNGSPTVNLSPRDPGLGSRRVAVVRSASTGTEVAGRSTVDGCGGARGSRCPTGGTYGLTYTVGEGTNRMRAKATDAIDRTGLSAEWSHRVDKTAPTFKLDRGQVKQGAKLASGSHALIVDANDLGANGAENSGVKQVEYAVDGGAPVVAAKTCLSGPCSHTFSIDTSATGLAEGSHTIRVKVTDGVALFSEQTFTILVDRTRPTIDSADGDLREVAVGAGTFDLAIAASDKGPVAATAGVQRIEVHRRDETGADRPPQVVQASSMLYQLDTTAASTGEGRQTIRSRAVDGAENASADDQFDVIVDRGAPDVPEPTGTLYLNRGQTITTPQTLTVAATDGSPTSRATERSGVYSIEIWVDDVEEHSVAASCDSGNCAKTTTWTFDPSQYPGGDHRIEIVVADEAGNVNSARSFNVTTACCARAQSTWALLSLPATTDAAYGDVTGDGFADLVERTNGTGEVRVSASNGADGFGDAVVWGATGFWLGRDLRLADVDGDEDSDLVGRDAQGAVWVAKAAGTAFGAADAWRPSGAPQQYHLADVDADGQADLVTAEAGAGGVALSASLSDDGDPWLAAEGLPGAAGANAEVHFADVTADGWNDLVTVENGDVKVAAALEDGFGAATTWATLSGAPEVALADMDGDEIDDLVTRAADGKLHVRRGVRTSFAPAVEWASPSADLDFNLADVDGNVQADFVGRNAAGSVAVLRTDVVQPIAEEGVDEYGASSEPVDDQWGEIDEDLSLAGTARSATQTTAAAATAPSLIEPGGDPSECTQLKLTARPKSGSFARRHRIGWSDDGQFAEVPLHGANHDPECFRYQRALSRTSEAGGRVVRMVVLWRRYMSDPDYRRQIQTAAFRLENHQKVDVFVTLTGAEYDRTRLSDGTQQPTPSNEFTASTADAFSATTPGVPDFGTFVETAVHDLMVQGVERFSIWNEPNLPRGIFLKASCPNVAPSLGRRVKRRSTIDLYRVLYREGYARAMTAADAANDKRAAEQRRRLRLQVWIGEFSESADYRYRKCDGSRFKSGRTKAFEAPEYLRRLVTGQSLHAHAVAWHPYQHRTSPRHRDTGNSYGIGRTGFIDWTVDDLRDEGLSVPGGTANRRASLHFTEFGYLNRPHRSLPGVRENVQASRYKSALKQAFKPDHPTARKPRLLSFWKLVESPTGTFDTGTLGDLREPQPPNGARPASPYAQVRGYRDANPYGANRWRQAYCDGIRGFTRIRRLRYRQAWYLDAGPRTRDEDCATARYPQP